ncbi:hypothetical protein [Photobacterium leiognathi]|nr:hypothetical protein [Photobacterium leiognathi]
MTEWEKILERNLALKISALTRKKFLSIYTKAYYLKNERHSSDAS